ncbi:MAG: MazG family protein [Elusimicrobia bacterium]|nr:MazG family protein [Elusimicrobiota bacterium]
MKSINSKVAKNFNKLIDIMARLRGTDGCAWDKKQTHASLLKYLSSETKEVRAAVKSGDPDNLCEELGDVLLQIVFHAQIAKENKQFDIADVIDTLNKKLIRRHPHVFTKNKTQNVKEIISRWNEIKAAEKAAKRQQTSKPRKASKT